MANCHQEARCEKRARPDRINHCGWCVGVGDPDRLVDGQVGGSAEGRAAAVGVKSSRSCMALGARPPRRPAAWVCAGGVVAIDPATPRTRLQTTSRAACRSCPTLVGLPVVSVNSSTKWTLDQVSKRFQARNP